jgi:hypothetical protein
MPERAVSVNEPIHPRLQGTFTTFDRLGWGAISFRQLSQLEPLKKRSPA